MSGRRFAWPMLVCWLLLAAATGPASASATGPVVSLLTFGPGEVYWQRFGHNALLVRERGRATVYNYGIFDFAQDDFIRNFAMGRMRYRVAEEPLQHALALYRHEGRWVAEQVLDLTPAQARSLADFLAWNARPENAEYRYDYFLSNCSTRVRDAIDLAIGGTLKPQLEARPAEFDLRQQVVRLTAPDLPLMLGLDAVLGPGADRPRSLWEEAFVPMVLQTALRDAQRPDEAGGMAPLVRSERLLIAARLPDPADAPPRLWPGFLLAGIVLGAALAGLAAGRARAARVAYTLLATPLLLAAGVVGLVMLGFWLLTEHWAGWANASLLLFNPLAFVLLPSVWAISSGRAPSRLMRGLALLLPASAIMALPLTLVQANLHWLLFWLPIHAAIAWTLLTARR